MYHPATLTLILTLILIFCFGPADGSSLYSRHEREAGTAEYSGESNSTTTTTTTNDAMPDLPSLLTTVYPGSGELFSPRKMWFARRIFDDLHFAGQLSRRQIKYASDSGFKAISSTFEHAAMLDGDGKEITPSSADERALVELAGMDYHEVLPLAEGGDWMKVSTVRKFNHLFAALKKPALVHCQTAVSIVFHVLMHYANNTRHDPEFEPKVDIRTFFGIAERLGLDYLTTFAVVLPAVEEITGEKVPDDVRAPNVSLATWNTFWPSFPVYHDWFIAGQIQVDQIPVIKKAGFVSVVNIRSDVTDGKGRPSQESVELVNIRSSTPTYGPPARQSMEGLKANIINATRPVEFISAESQVNYESSNPEEFGDHVGHNEALEAATVKGAGLHYSIMPWAGKNDDFRSYMKTNIDALMQISKNGPVLVHCARGYRAALVAVLVAGVQYDLSFEWGLQRLREMGFGITPTSHPDVYQTYSEMLRHAPRVEL